MPVHSHSYSSCVVEMESSECATAEDTDADQLATAHCTTGQQNWGGRVFATAMADHTAADSLRKNATELRRVVKGTLCGCRASALTRLNDVCKLSHGSYHCWSTYCLTVFHAYMQGMSYALQCASKYSFHPIRIIRVRVSDKCTNGHLQMHERASDRTCTERAMTIGSCQ